MLVFLRLAVLGLILASTVPAAAAGFATVGLHTFTWEGLFVSGRVSALGGSDLADPGPATLLINPAPLFTGNGVELSYDNAGFDSNTDFNSYAGAAEWNNWRLNFAVQDFVVDSALIRTAYNPEGNGETYNARERMVVIGLGFDLGEALFEDPAFGWSVGAAWRRYSSTWIETTAGGNSLDLGTTFGTRVEYENGWTGLTGAVAWQNVTDETITADGRESHLPKQVRAGLTLEAAFKHAGGSYDLFKLLMAYSRVFRSGDYNSSDFDHVGIEALFYDALAFRYGYNTRTVEDIRSWGIGVILDGRLLGPFTVEIDWGEMDYQYAFFGDNKTIWGVRARYNF